MHNHSVRRLLRIATMLVILFCGGLVWLSLRPPLQIEDGRAEVAPVAGRGNDGVEAVRPVLDFSSLANRPLRGPLVDQPRREPPAVEAPAKSPKPRPATVDLRRHVRLLGTMIEAEQSVAILVNPAGEIELANIGQTIETAIGRCVIKRIEPKLVDILVNQETLTLRLP